MKKHIPKFRTGCAETLILHKQKLPLLHARTMEDYAAMYCNTKIHTVTFFYEPMDKIMHKALALTNAGYTLKDF